MGTPQTRVPERSWLSEFVLDLAVLDPSRASGLGLASRK